MTRLGLAVPVAPRAVPAHRGRRPSDLAVGPGFADGARFAELAVVPAADLVVAAIAAALGLSTSADKLLSDLDAYGASKLLDEGQSTLQELRDDDLAGYERLQYLLTAALVDNFLGQVRLSQGDNDAAARLFTDGMIVARRAQDRLPILISLYDLALCRKARGDPAQAAGHLKEGLAHAAEAGDETSAVYYLEGLAAVARQLGDSQRAARLLAAARSLLETSGSGWPHAYVPRVPHGDDVLAALRADLGDAAFEEAQAWGRSVGSRRAVQYALE